MEYKQKLSYNRSLSAQCKSFYSTWYDLQYHSRSSVMSSFVRLRPVTRESWGLKTPPIPKSPQISLCRLHTWSRASMGQDRLSSLAMLHVHYMHKIDWLEVLWTRSLRNIQDACSWTVCCSTDFDILGLSNYWPNCRFTYLLTAQWFSSITLNDFNVM